MKQVIKHGIEIDTATPEEVKQLLSTSYRAAEPTILRARASVNTGADGTFGPLGLYSVPAGYEAYLHRVVVTSPAYPASAPLTVGDVTIVHNADQSDVDVFFPINGYVAPVIYTDNGTAATRYRGNETIDAYGTGLPDNIQLLFVVQLRLWQGDAHRAQG